MNSTINVVSAGYNSDQLTACHDKTWLAYDEWMNENEDILFPIAVGFVKNQCKAVNRNTKLILKPQNLYLHVYIVKETLNISSTTELTASL